MFGCLQNERFEHHALVVPNAAVCVFPVYHAGIAYRHEELDDVLELLVHAPVVRVRRVKQDFVGPEPDVEVGQVGLYDVPENRAEPEIWVYIDARELYNRYARRRT